MLEYKSYIGHVEFDEEADIFHGEVINTKDVITFQGKNTDELRRSFKESIDIYLDFCKKRGKSPDKPFSGNFLVRCPTPDYHRRFYIAACAQGLSLNKWVIETLKKNSKVNDQSL